MPKPGDVLIHLGDGRTLNSGDVVRSSYRNGEWLDYAAIVDRDDAEEAVKLVNFYAKSPAYKNKRFQVVRDGRIVLGAWDPPLSYRVGRHKQRRS
jgi:hypothetical protein